MLVTLSGPTWVSTLEESRGTRPDLSLPGPVVVNGDYAYVCVHRRPSTPGAFLQAIDISDPV